MLIDESIDKGFDTIAEVVRFRSAVLPPLTSALAELRELGAMGIENMDLINRSRDMLTLALLRESASLLNMWEEALILVPGGEEEDDSED